MTHLINSVNNLVVLLHKYHAISSFVQKGLFSHRYSGAVLFAKVLGLIALLEYSIMLLFEVLPPLPPWLENGLDAGLLSLIATPFLWRWIVVSDRERRKAEQTLIQKNEEIELARNHLEQFRRAIDAFSIVALTDASGVITEVNDKFCAISGYSREELLGKTHRIVNSGIHEAGFFREMWATIGEGKIWHGEICNRRKDGELYYVDSLIMPFLDAAYHDRKYIAIRHDITDRKKAAVELERLAKEAQMASETKALFLANMSHEIRTPMNAIIGMTGLLLDMPIQKEQREFIDIIRQSGEQLLVLINDILDFSKIESGHMEFESSIVDWRECVESSLDLVASLASEKKLDLIYWIDPSVPPAFYGDITRLRQVLVNLLSNGLKFTERGEIFISCNMKNGDQSGDTRPRLHVAVRDSGVGISQESRNRLFQSFSQVDASTTRKYGGTGLGLAISQRLIELMGGRIWVESDVGKGSTFQFEIPITIAELPGRMMVHTRNGTMDGRRILVIDDNDTNRQILKLQIEQWGSHVRCASSAEEGWSWIERGDPIELVLTDFKMEGMNGLELVNKIRESESVKELPVILMTSMGVVPNSDNSGNTKCLVKPVRAQTLYDEVQHILLGSVKRASESPRESDDGKTSENYPLKILLAEDNVVNQKVANLILKRMGYRPDTVANGLEVLEALRQRDYDVILLDVQMPEMDGLSVAREVCRIYDKSSRPRMIAMTANALQGDRERCIDAGMDDYLSKPVRKEEILQRLKATYELIARN